MISIPCTYFSDFKCSAFNKQLQLLLLFARAFFFLLGLLFALFLWSPISQSLALICCCFLLLIRCSQYDREAAACAASGKQKAAGMCTNTTQASQAPGLHLLV